MANVKAETFTGMFKFQEGIFNNAFDGLTNEKALIKPSEQSNHINRILGHVLHCRFMLINMLGDSSQNPFGNIYWEPNEKEYPSIEEILEQWPIICKKLENKIKTMSDEQLDAQPEEKRPSLSNIISFFIYHESYHLGQVGYARKIVGLNAMKAN